MRRYFWVVLAISLALRIAFLFYTNFTAEDAYITFQFARNLARGNGFALNPGTHIYGSTTPLLTFLLAGWLFLSKDIVLGARIIDVAAFSGGLIFLYGAIPFRRAAVFAVLIIGLSGKLVLEEMQGMEMPLLFLFMAGSFYGFMKGKPTLAGIMAGLLLWTRVDAAVWVACLFLIYLVMYPRDGLKYAVATSVIYLPWVLFAWWYFGSPVPFTVIAKQVAYGIGNPPYRVHLARIVDYLTIPAALGAVLGAFAVGRTKYRVLPLFFVLETAVLVLSGSTFFSRYFYLLSMVAYTLLGIGVGFVVERMRYKTVLMVLVTISILLASAISIRDRFEFARARQTQWYETLKDVGVWLNQNTPEDSTVLLEPLGYVGWYADRIMIDEVGLVTPAVVELHRQEVSGVWFFTYFWPDYVIQKCETKEARGVLDVYYDLAETFDCYEIWKRIDKPLKG